jgi:DNA-binding NarL/FixJ family response regulator
MQPLSVVLLQSDPGTVQSLVALRGRFHRVSEARSIGDLRARVFGLNPEVVILDMEMASVSEVALLARDFPDVRIVCNHRLADDKMWTATLEAGASDCCASGDIRGICQAALRVAGTHSRAA